MLLIGQMVSSHYLIINHLMDALHVNIVDSYHGSSELSSLMSIMSKLDCKDLVADLNWWQILAGPYGHHKAKMDIQTNKSEP